MRRSKEARCQAVSSIKVVLINAKLLRFFEQHNGVEQMNLCFKLFWVSQWVKDTCFILESIAVSGFTYVCCIVHYIWCPPFCSLVLSKFWVNNSFQTYVHYYTFFQSCWEFISRAFSSLKKAIVKHKLMRCLKPHPRSLLHYSLYSECHLSPLSRGEVNENESVIADTDEYGLCLKEKSQTFVITISIYYTFVVL